MVRYINTKKVKRMTDEQRMRIEKLPQDQRNAFWSGYNNVKKEGKAMSTESVEDVLLALEGKISFEEASKRTKERILARVSQ